MGKTQKSTTDTTSNIDRTSTGSGTTTPNVPDWIRNPAMGIAGGVGDILGQGASQFGPSLSSENLQKARWGAHDMNVTPQYSGARNVLQNMQDVDARDVTGESVLSNLESYYNPFKSQVLNPVMTDYDAAADETRAAQSALAGRNKAFQGSRFGVQEGATEGQLARGRASTEGGLLKDMYEHATGLSAGDAGRRQQAALANQQADLQADIFNNQNQLEQARLGSSLTDRQQEHTRANIGLQAGLGADEADRLTAYNQYPLEYLKQAGGILQGLDPRAFIGQDVTSTEHEVGTETGTSTATQKKPFKSFLGDLLVATAGSGRSAAMAGMGG